jgi:TDG/mug DNA glycosylase family protein
VVFCGTAAGTESAARGAYYAGRGNKFWRILHDTGLTPIQLRAEQFERLRDYGIGLTDVCKTTSGMDHEIPAGAFEPAQLREAIARCAPLAVAFNGKRSAQIALGIRKGATLDYGRAPVSFAGAPTWVLPSTSGAASGKWSPEPWQDLARSLSTPDLPSAGRPGAGSRLERWRAGAVVAFIVLTGVCLMLRAIAKRSTLQTARTERSPDAPGTSQ